MIEKLGKLEIFKLINYSVLWFEYLYLVIKIKFTLTILVLSRVKFTIVMETGNKSVNSYFFKIIWSYSINLKKLYYIRI